MSLYQRLAGLPVQIDAVRFYGDEGEFGFVRRTTTVSLLGGGLEGRGEDVTYEAVDHDVLQSSGWEPAIEGRASLGELSGRLGDIDLFPRGPEREGSRDYRRWAFESAALDLALRQAGTSLHECLDIEPRPLRFVVSTGLGEPPTLEPVRALRRQYPDLRFKLDPGAGWDRELVGALAHTGAVDVLDFKGAYEGTPVDTEPDPDLTRRLAEAFPDALLEDPHRDARVLEALQQHRSRVSWDAIIHSVADVEALPFPPRWLNIKPSRFGTIERLLDMYAWCRDHDVRMYGGGQFELGVGRGQIQLLAALFHPEGPNDVAPLDFGDTPVPSGLPSSSLTIRAGVGFAGDAG